MTDVITMPRRTATLRLVERAPGIAEVIEMPRKTVGEMAAEAIADAVFPVPRMSRRRRYPVRVGVRRFTVAPASPAWRPTAAKSRCARSQPTRAPTTRARIAGMKPKDLVGVPWLAAFALRDRRFGGVRAHEAVPQGA